MPHQLRFPPAFLQIICLPRSCRQTLIIISIAGRPSAGQLLQADMMNPSHARRLLQTLAPAGTLAASDAAAQTPAISTIDQATPPVSGDSPFHVGSQFSPTMVIILVILLSSFFFMGFFAFYVRRCANDDNDFHRPRGRTAAGAGGNHTPRRLASPGLDPATVESFPIVSYAAAKKKGCNECVVCLADFERGDELKQLPKCKHVFHPECIGMWLESHTTCPLCRRNLLASDRWSLSWRWGGSSRGTPLLESMHSSRGPAGTGGGDSREQEAASPADQNGSAATASPRPVPPCSNLPLSTTEIVSEQAPAVCMTSDRPEVASAQGTVAGRLPPAAMTTMQGRHRLGRSNSTGHSLRKEAMSRAGTVAAAEMRSARPMGCMLRGRSQGMQRSTSTRLRTEEESVGPGIGGSSGRRGLKITSASAQ